MIELRLLANATLLSGLIKSQPVQGLVVTRRLWADDTTLLVDLITFFSVQGLVGSETLMGGHHSTSRSDNILFSSLLAGRHSWVDVTLLSDLITCLSIQGLFGSKTLGFS